MRLEQHIHIAQLRRLNITCKILTLMLFWLAIAFGFTMNGYLQAYRFQKIMIETMHQEIYRTDSACI